MYTDIFGIPIWKTQQAQKNEFVRLVHQISKCGLNLDKSFDFLTIQTLVYSGFLSCQTASYFLTGRFSKLQEFYLREFIKFLNDFVTINGFSFSKIHRLWLQEKRAVPDASSFVFPLEELGFSFEFYPPSWSETVVDDLPE